jgi:hypothetical protein
MNSDKEKVILLEHSKSHQDILYAQLLFLLESGYKPVLWINKELAFDTDIIGKDIEIIKYEFGNSKERKIFKRNLKDYVRENKITNVILNTAQGIQARNIVFKFLFTKINFVGILHEAERLFSSFTQKTISFKIKKYFVLNDYIAEYSENLRNKRINIKALYPFFIPYQNKSNEFLSNKLLICIPGEVSVDRKNYKHFLETLKENTGNLSSDIRFIFLGSPRNEEGRDIIKKVKKLGLDNIIRTYDNYINEEEYLKSIYESDLVMPLIDPEVKYFKEYSSSKISGAYTLAFSFRKPLLMHNSMKHIEDFRNLAFFYDSDNLINTINDLSQNKISIEEKKKKYNQIEKFSFEYQRKQYISFLA